MSKLVFTLLFSLMSSLAFASEVHLVKATNDEDNEICDLYLVLDEQKDISECKMNCKGDSSRKCGGSWR